jgi:flagellar biosynthesis protein FlhG
MGGSDHNTGTHTGRIIAVGGGKGGVGKTLVSTHLALALAARGHRTLLVDADLGGANAHSLLGIAPPAVTLSDFVSKAASLDDVAVTTPYRNLRFISGALDDMGAANPQHAAKMRLLRHLSQFDTDYLVLDLGAGTSFNTLDFFLLADHGVLVVLPEPTSIENAYRFLKAAFFRRMAVVEKAFGIKDLVDEARAHKNTLGIHTPADLLRVIAERDPVVGREVRAQMARFEPLLVLNQTRSDVNGDDRVVADDMANACNRFLGIRLRVLSCLPDDDAVRRTVRLRQPLTLTAPSAPITLALDNLTVQLLARDAAQGHAA